MKIRRMTATFGSLQNQTLELKEGLNLIEAPNEAGKSTWAAFLRAMLYGIPTKERDRQGFLAEKNRYQPWSGAAMEGRLELEWGGREIVLLRGPGKSAPFAAFQALDAATGEPIPGLTAENAGEVIIGAPREVFERSAFLGQGASVIDGAPALEKRVSALVSSGEEDVSYSQVERTLRDWLNRRRHNKTGLIPRLEEELAGLEDQLARQSRAHRTAQEAGQTLSELQEERELLTRELSAHRARARKERQAAWEQAQGELEAARQEEDTLRQALNKDGPTPARETLLRIQEALNSLRGLEQRLKGAEQAYEAAIQAAADARKAAADPLFPDMTPEAAWDRANLDADEVELEEPASGGTLAAALALLAGTAAAAAAGLAISLFAFPAAAVLGVGSLFLFARWVKLRREAAGIAARREELLDWYHVDDSSEILELARAYRKGWEAARDAERERQRAEQAQIDLMNQRDRVRGQVSAQVQAFAPAARDVFTLSTALSRALFLQDKLERAVLRRESAEKLLQRLPVPQSPEAEPEADGLTPRYDSVYTGARLSAVEEELRRLSAVEASARGELKTLGDPVLAQARREAAQEELEQRRLEYGALSLALEGLSAAGQALQGRFAPALNREAGALFTRLTGGKYGGVTLTREFEALAQESGAVLPRRSLALSRGTADQLYLAVRLAVCQLALPQEDPAPLVLDDALANFDDLRCARALELLLELARERQILLFTCHGREGHLLAGVTEIHRARFAPVQDQEVSDHG